MTGPKTQANTFEKCPFCGKAIVTSVWTDTTYHTVPGTGNRLPNCPAFEAYESERKLADPFKGLL